MKFINNTKNTIKLHDINRVIAFNDYKVDSIDVEMVKKSKVFQDLVISGKFEIIEASDDRVEQNLFKLARGFVPLLQDKYTFNVRIKGQMFNNAGYAKANKNLLFALARLGVSVSAEVVGETNDGLNEVELRKIKIFQKPEPKDYILIHSTIPSFCEKNSGLYNILWTTNEASSIPEQFVDACKNYDEIWVVSDFCKEVFEKSGVRKPIFVLPNSVDYTLYNQKKHPITLYPELKKFRFISVLSWNWRKGYDVLLKAYLEEFSANDDVSLLIVTKYINDGDGNRRFEIENEIKDFISKYGGKNHPHIARCGASIPEGQMPGIYRSCNSFVLPSRGEGFGLPYLEASLCGLPVIATNHSGHTMFLNNENSYLLDVDEPKLIDKQTEIHFWDGQLFPMLDGGFDKRLGSLMREVYNSYDVALEKNRNLQKLAVTHYSPDVIAKMAADRMEKIWKNLLSY